MKTCKFHQEIENSYNYIYLDSDYGKRWYMIKKAKEIAKDLEYNQKETTELIAGMEISKKKKMFRIFFDNFEDIVNIVYKDYVLGKEIFYNESGEALDNETLDEACKRIRIEECLEECLI